MAGPTFTITLVRGFTRLRQIFWTYVTATGKESRDFAGPGNANYLNANDSYSWMCTIGSRKFPERNSEGVSEAFVRLRQAAATFYGQDSIAISPETYMKTVRGLPSYRALISSELVVRAVVTAELARKMGQLSSSLSTTHRFQAAAP